MKRTVILIISFFCLTLSHSQTINQMVVNEKGKEKLLGKINREGLTTNSFNSWYHKNYDNYLVNDKVVEALKDSLNQYTIKAFLGTWCGDSRRELPRFYNILDAANFPEAQLEVIALDRTQEAYKRSPNAEEKGLNIHRVPTFIFYKDGKEVNRIVEFPKQTLERDILSIVTENKYTPNYMAANYLDNLIQEKGLDSLRNIENELGPRLAEFVKGSRELNTLGYVKLRANQIDEALYIFNVNTKIFPYKSNVYDSLGEGYYDSKNYEEALKNYNKVLELRPEDENAKAMIVKIKSEMN
jgi:thiol-disulfide isomerase/thioredoxin